ncbi:protein kintoun [Neosynchiropus ocellatus]
MEVSDKLKELDMTSDEVDRFTQAFKDERFREMLREYAEEISDPENKKKYEEEMTLLEQERGNHVDFIHPEPFRALRTSVDGKQKCFINICSNEKVAKPECAPGRSEDGRRGQRWSLPHSLHPGRQHSDKKGVKQMVYDVVFHPDTLHIAGKNSRFMDMVKSTAIQGIQNAFKVTLDSKNVRELKVTYKGTPQPCIIRKPIPGYEAKESSEGGFSVPYPDQRPKPAEPQNFQLKPETPQEPTKPRFSIKYRSYIDMQDYTCSKDSTQRTRPKEIVVTIDLPLLKTVADTNLDVKEKMLLLECEKPAYKLELPLSFPVDGDKGEAKFNKVKAQLTVTLPVLPAASLSFEGEEKNVVEDVTEAQMGELEHEERLDSGNEMIQVADKEDTVTEETRKRVDVENKKEKIEEEETMKNTWREVEEQNVELQDTLKGKEVDFQPQVNKMDCRNEKLLEDKEEDERNTNKADLMEENLCDSMAVQEQEDMMTKRTMTQEEEEGLQSVVKPDKSLEMNTYADPKVHGLNEMSQQAPEVTESVEVQKSSSIHQLDKECSEEEHGQEEIKCERSAEEWPDCIEEEKKVEEQNQLNVEEHSYLNNDEAVSHIQQMETGLELHIESSHPKEAETALSEMHLVEQDVEKCEVPQAVETSVDTATQEKSVICDNGVDEDDLPSEQIVQTPEFVPPAVLREVGKDGKETIIYDHSTSAGFTFQNSLMFELD